MSQAALPYWRLSGFYFCYFALLGATAPFLALYLDHLGFSSARIGELLAIPMLMRCISPNLWGWLGDRSGRRLAIVRFGAFCTLCSFALILFGTSYAWLALIMALYAFFWHAVLPQFEVLTLAHLGEQTARYSQVRLWGSVGFILAVVGLGELFERVSLEVFPWVLIGIIGCIFASSWWVPNAQLSAARDNPLSGGFLRQLRQPGVLAFFLVVGLMQLSHGPYYTFISLYLESLGYARGVIGLLWAIGVVAEILVFLLMARLLHAATFGSFHSVCVLVVSKSFNARQQGQGQALYAAVSGLGGGLGALFAGYSWSGLGPSWTFFSASVVALLGALIIYRQMPVGQAGV